MLEKDFFGYILIFMRERLTISTKDYPRLLDFPLKLRSVDWVPGNYHGPDKGTRSDIIFSIDLRFNEMYYIVKDGAEERRKLEHCEIKCILPGDIFWYETKYQWDELYFCYEAKYKEVFKQFGLDLDVLHKQPIKILDHSLLNHQIDEILAVCRQSYREGVSDRLDVLLYNLLMSHYLDNREHSLHNHLSEKMRSALDYLHANFRNHKIMPELLRKLGMSERTFRREWAKYNDTPVYAYLTELRLSYVRQLLLNTDMNLKEIAEESGFGCSVDICRHFRRYYRTSPMEFRKQR